jgi:hypothetical protein
VARTLALFAVAVVAPTLSGCCAAACVAGVIITVERPDQSPLSQGRYDVSLLADRDVYMLSCEVRSGGIPGSSEVCVWTELGPFGEPSAYSPYATVLPESRGIMIHLSKVTPRTATIEITRDGALVTSMTGSIHYRDGDTCNFADCPQGDFRVVIDS